MPTIEQRLGEWQQELLDLSSRNRLLNFRPSTTRPSSIQLVQPAPAEMFRTLLQGTTLRVVGREPADEDDEVGPDLEVSEESAQSVRLLETPSARVGRDGFGQPSRSPGHVPPGTVLSNLVIEKNNKVAARLLANARASEQEQGVNILFAAFGLLRWKERPGEATWRQSPLVLLPVKIEEQVREGGFRISSTGDDPEFNQTLGERLKRDFGLELSIDVDEDSSLSTVLEDVQSAIAGQREWSVLDQAHLGTFQFHKLRMFTDLVEHAGVAIDHDIVQALALDGVGIAPLPDGLPFEEDLDRVVTPDRSFTVLDADASQLRAVQAAVRGSHLIIEGPPGTGKSQTIANIIAESIAAGKTVLFVSEKAAAIEVVHRRLVERGLGDLCLMLHSHKANKRDVIYDLGNQLTTVSVTPANAREDVATQRLQETRAELNSYAEALHRVHEPMGESVFWAHGRLAGLQDAPYLTVSAPTAQLTHERLATWERVLEQAGRYADHLREGVAQPWSGVRREYLTTGDQETIRHTMGAVGAALAEVQEAGDALATLIGVAPPDSDRESRELVTLTGLIPVTGRLDSSWFAREGSGARVALTEEASSRAAAAVAAREKLLTSYDKGILEIATTDALASYRRGSLARLFSSSYRAYRSTMRGLATDRKQRSPADEIQVLVGAEGIRADDAWWAEHHDQLTTVLGRSSGGTINVQSTWTQVQTDLAAVGRLMGRFDAEIPTALVELVAQSRPRDTVQPIEEGLKGALDRLKEHRERLSDFFEVGGHDRSLLSDSAAPFGDVAKWVGLHTARLADLDPMLRARSAKYGVDEAGLATAFDHLLSENVAPERWVDGVHRLVVSRWLDERYRGDEALLAFNGREHQAIVDQFRNLDRQHRDASARRIRRAVAARRAGLDGSNGGEPELVRREAAKRKRHLPVRRLFERIPNLLPTLKPCLMMSPLSVAQFLPADRYRFDLVIFDEASQVKPHDAIGAIMRGRQIIVAGDRKQLPPTNFFDRSADEGLLDDEQDIRALESILDALRAKAMPSTQLLWHYRSRHEDLIAFSNRNFYDGQLITFPSASADRSPTHGVRLDHVPDAVYEDERDAILTTAVRVNRVEARRVAALIMQHAKTRPDESLGVVALNMRQKEVIEDELKQARLLDRSADQFFDEGTSDQFFVKALEQVQGDERDVIMISVGFGKNRDGVLSHNFGPINQEGGERRLNVLVTRARLQVVVVSSIKAGDIDPTKTSRRGPQLLRSYLDFAERGPIALDAQTTGGDGDFESPFEEQVWKALSQAGYTVRPQVGTSRFRIDLAIVHPEHPGRYILGIECDGKTYHQSKTARDRDRLRQEILEGLGWTIHRIWSTDWIRHPDQELDRVLARVEELMRQPDPEPLSQGTVSDAPDPNAGTVDVDSDTPDVLDGQRADEPRLTQLAVPYAIAEVRAHHGGYGNILSVGPHLIADVVTACVDVEGPIHRDLLVRRVSAGFGHQRAGTRIAAHVDAAVGIAVRHEAIRRQGTFLQPAEERAIVPRGPAPDGTLREIGHISDEEISTAMVLLVERAFSLSQDELIARASRLFGFQRTGSDIRFKMEDVADRTVRDGVLEVRDGRYQLPRR